MTSHADARCSRWTGAGLPRGGERAAAAISSSRTRPRHSRPHLLSAVQARSSARPPPPHAEALAASEESVAIARTSEKAEASELARLLRFHADLLHACKRTHSSAGSLPIHPAPRAQRPMTAAVRTGGAAAAIPWHPGMHAPAPRDPHAARLPARSLRHRCGGLAARHAGPAGGRGRLRLAQAALGCTPARGLDDAARRRARPDGHSLYVASATPASVTAFNVDRATACCSSSTSRRLPSSLAQEGCGAARAARGRLGDRGLARQPARLRHRAGSGAVVSFARQPNGSLVQLAGLAGCVVTPPAPRHRLRQRAGARRRRRDRDLARRPLRLRRRHHGRLAPRVRPRRRDRAADAARRHARLPAPQPHHLHARHRHRRAVGDRDHAGRDLALRRLGDGTLTVVPARRGDRGADPAPPRRRLPERRADRRLHGHRGPRARLRRRDHARRAHRDRRRHRRRRGALLPARSGDRRPHARVLRLGLRRDAGCTPSTLIGGPRSLAVRPYGLVVWVGASRGDSIVTLQIDATTGALTPTPGPGGCVRRLASVGLPRGAGARRSARAGRERRRRARLRGQRAERRHRRARPAARAQLPEGAGEDRRQPPNSVVLACSDPNGDKIALTIVRRPATGASAGSSRRPRASPTARSWATWAGLVHLHGDRRAGRERAGHRHRDRDAAAQGAEGEHPHRAHAPAAAASASTCSSTARRSPSGPAGSRCT